MNIENYKRYFPTITQSIILCLLIVGVTIIIAVPVAIFADLANLKIDILVWLNVPVFFVVFLVGYKWSRKPFHKFFLHKRVSMQLISISFMTAFGLIILLGEFENIILHFFPISNEVMDMFDMLLSGGSGVLAAIIMASITEEVLFRGMILPGLAQNYGKTTGIIVTALLFGIIHLNPWQFVPAFIMGVFLGWIYLETKNIWLCIGLHGFNNALAAIPFYLGIEIPGIVYDARDGVQFQPLWLDVIGVVLFIVGFVILKGNTTKNYDLE